MPILLPNRNLTKAGFSKPPQGAVLNPDHMLGDAVEYYPFNEYNGKNVRNHAPNGANTLASSASIWNPAGIYGGGLQVGANSQTCVTPFALTVPTQVTLVVYFARTASVTNNGVIAVLRQSGTSNNQVGIQYDSTGSNLALNMATSAGTNKSLNIAAANIVLNTWYQLVAAFDRNAGTISAWLNLTAFSGSPGQAVTASTTSHSIALGGTATGTGTQGSTVAHFSRYNRLLTLSDAQTLAADPWAPLLVPALRRYWVVSGSVDTPTHPIIVNQAVMRAATR